MYIPVVGFNPSDVDKGLLDIIDLEDLSQRKSSLDHSPEQPHRVEFSLLVYIEKGQGAHFIDFIDWPFESGDFIFVNKNQVNAFDLSNQPKGSAILFTDEFIDKVQSNMTMPLFSPTYLKNDYQPVLKPTDSLKASCESLLHEINKEISKEDNGSLVKLFLFSALLLILEREKSSDAVQHLNMREKKQFAKFTDAVGQQFHQSRNAAAYAAELNISYKTLNQLSKKATSLTAKQFIDAYTILEAKRRLTIAEQSIQQLAYQLGFDEVTNFTKYFKKHTNINPSSFQKKHA